MMYTPGSIVGKLNNGEAVFARSDVGADTHIHVGEKALSEMLSKIPVPFSGYFRGDVKISAECEEVSYCVETNDDDVIVYRRRGERFGESRMVLNRTPEATTSSFIVLCSDTANENRITIVTAFAGIQAEKEPWDPSIKTEEQKAKAEAFWSTHALIPEE